MSPKLRIHDTGQATQRANPDLQHENTFSSSCVNAVNAFKRMADIIFLPCSKGLPHLRNSFL